MPRGVQRDSIAKCDLYSNPYDTRMQSHPALVRQRQENFARSQDTLASAQSRLEKDIFQRLQDANFQLPLGKFIFIGALGKYAFLALMLPPYIFCYGIPKWLLTEGLPKFFGVTTHMIRRISDKVADVAHGFVNAFRSFGRKITSPILNYIQTKVEKTRELYARARGAVLAVLSIPERVLNQLFLQPIASYVEKMQEGLAKLTAIYKDLREKGKFLKESVRHFFVYLPNHILNKSSEIFSLFQSNLLQPLIKPLRPFIDWSGEALTTLSSAFSSTKGRFIDFIDRNLLQPCRSAQERIKASVKEVVKTMLQPVIDWMDPKLEAVRKGWEKVKEKISRLKERTKENLKAISETVESSVKKTYQLASEAVQQIVQLIPQPVLTLFQPIVALVSAPFNYRRTHKVFKTFMKKVYEKIHSGLRYAEKWIGKGKAACRKLIRKSWEKIKVIPMRLFRLLKRIARFVLTALIGSFLLIRLMLAWVRALLRYGMLLVREKSRNLLTTSR